VFGELPGSKVVAAVDRDPAKLDHLNGRFPNLRLERDYTSLFADKEVEAVVVATPTETHYIIVRDALLAGKHVLCEKPLCESAADARKLIELAKMNHLYLMTGHVFLFNEGLITLKEVIRSDRLGSIRYLSAIRTNLGPVRHDVNAAYDLAAHDVAIFNWLLNGKPIQVSACGAAYLQSGIEDVVSLSLIYPRDVFATVHASWLSPMKLRRLSVIGERRMAMWEDGDSAAAVTVFDKGAAVRAGEDGDAESEIVSMWDGETHRFETSGLEPLKVQAQHFLRGLHHPDAEARSDCIFALGVIEVLEAACRSIRAGGAPIAVSQEKAN